MKRSPTNQKTLQSYERCVSEYVAMTYKTVTGGVKAWLDCAVFGLQPEAKVLEIGAAFGRDVAYVQDKGLSVVCTDAAQGFVELLLKNGYNACCFDVLTDGLPASHYDLIYANAVLLHFTEPETDMVLGKVHQALRTNGRFAFTVKRGDRQFWSDDKLGAPRFFRFWTREYAENVLAKAGFVIQYISEDSSGHDSTDWLSLVAVKPDKTTDKPGHETLESRRRND